MKRPSESKTDQYSLRQKIIGLGERSMRKSYYPQLQREAEFLKEKSAALLNMLTDLEEAKKKLEDSESVYRSIFENTGTATVIIEEDQKISLANSQFADLSGYLRDETEGKKSWTDFVAEEDLERMQEYHRLRNIDPKAALQGCEFRFVDRHGRIRDIFLTMDRIAGTSKTVASLLDITERKRAEEQSQVYLRFFESLEQVERAIRKAQDLDQMVLDVLDTVRGIFQSDRAWLLHPCDPDAPSFRVLMIRTDEQYPVDLTPDVDLPIAPDVAEAFQTALSTSGPVTFDPQSGRAIPLGKEYSIRSQMILAVHPRVGRPWVFGMHQCSYARVWTEPEQHLFNEIGRRMADGLGNMLFLRELQKNEEKYRTLVETLNEGLVVLDSTGVITYNNRNMAEMLGYSESELMGKLGTDFADEASRKILKERFSKQASGEIVSDNYEATLTGKDGRSVPVLMSTNALLHQGAFKGSVVAIVDLTKHKEAQEALRESEERYRLHFEHASDVVYSYDTQFRLVSISPSVERILGYAPEELIGKSFMELNVLAPESLESAYASASRVLAGGRVNAAEFHFVAKDGTKLIGEVSGAPIMEGEKVIGAVAIARDITDRKQAEQALRASEETTRLLIDESPLGIGITQNGIRVYANPALAKMYGFENQNEMMGLPATEFIDSRDRELRQQVEHDILAGKDTPTSYEIRGIRKNGERFDMVFWPRKIEYQGNPAVLSFAADTSESTRLKAQLVQAQKMEAVGTLAGGIAHDFNNLLTIILGYSELILADKSKGDPNYTELRAIRQTVARAAELVQRILTFSRKVETRRRPLNLNVEVNKARELLTRTIPKMISIDLVLDDELKNIDADPGQIEQLLLNLAVNAKHAIGERKGKIVVETKRVWLDEEYCKSHLEAEPGEYALLSVSDTGHGMEKEVLDHIFEPFFTTKKAGEGTGLGLAMVFGIVQGHGGHITCYSEPGMGTTFRIYFPVIETEAKPDDTTTQIVPSYGSETILLVDDEELIRDFGKKVLSRAGYHVLTAENGQEALEIYREKKNDIALVILDLIMPEMSGKECLEKLLQVDPKAKVIIGSGYLPEETTRESIQRQAKGFIGKPYQLKEILSLIRKVLD